MSISSQNKKITSGFVSVVGRTNAGKSTLLNALANAPLALVSKKANATRKKMDFILPFSDENFDSQIIFLDTPGFTKESYTKEIFKKNLIDKYMLKEANNAILESDLSLFISVASSSENEVKHYENFIKKYQKKHILLLNKIDSVTHSELLKILTFYEKYSKDYISLIPLSAANLKDKDKNLLLKEIAKNLPEHPHFYDDQSLSTTLMRDIYKEVIRECIYEYFSDEIPYKSDVRTLSVSEKPNVIVIKAQIIVEKESQKAIIIGRGGKGIRALGTLARKKCEALSECKVFLDLQVKVIPGWSKEKGGLKYLGYEMGE